MRQFTLAQALVFGMVIGAVMAAIRIAVQEYRQRKRMREVKALIDLALARKELDK